MCYRIGPIETETRTWYCVRGERGAVTYNTIYDKMGSIDIHSASNNGSVCNESCEWLGGARCYCDGRSTTITGDIFKVLEEEYKKL